MSETESKKRDERGGRDRVREDIEDERERESEKRRDGETESR